jgi:hypothetical protein
MILKVSIHIFYQHLSYLMEKVVEVKAGMGSFADRMECGSMQLMLRWKSESESESEN